jgi:hypothetical protein
MPVHRIDREATKALNDARQAAKEQLAAGAGLALAQWSVVESMLTFTFVAILDRERRPAQRGLVAWETESLQRRMYHTIFNAIISLDVRVDILSAVVDESDLRKGIKEVWPGVATRIKRCYKSRHEAAHFIFDELLDEKGALEIYLAPFPTTVVSPTTKRLSRAHLDHKAERFVELGDALRWIWAAIETQRRRMPALREPAPALIQRVRHSLKTRNQEASE